MRHLVSLSVIGKYWTDRYGMGFTGFGQLCNCNYNRQKDIFHSSLKFSRSEWSPLSRQIDRQMDRWVYVVRFEALDFAKAFSRRADLRAWIEIDGKEGWGVHARGETWMDCWIFLIELNCALIK